MSVGEMIRTTARMSLTAPNTFAKGRGQQCIEVSTVLVLKGSGFDYSPKQP